MRTWDQGTALWCQEVRRRHTSIEATEKSSWSSGSSGSTEWWGNRYETWKMLEGDTGNVEWLVAEERAGKVWLEWEEKTAMIVHLFFCKKNMGLWCWLVGEAGRRTGVFKMQDILAYICCGQPACCKPEIAVAPACPCPPTLPST